MQHAFASILQIAPRTVPSWKGVKDVARKQKFDYFQAFVQISGYAVEYATELFKYLEKNVSITNEGREPDIEHAIQRFKELHLIEEKADGVKHGIIAALSTEFIAPIEREDILALADELDDLVDDLDEVLQRMYMYDVHSITPDVLELARIAVSSTEAVQAACVEFVNFKKSTTLRDLIVKIDDCEDEADRIYIAAMHDAYARARNEHALDAFGVGHVLTSLEKVCDACEGVGSTITTVIMKNS